MDDWLSILFLIIRQGIVMIVYVYGGYVTSVECQFSLHLNTSYSFNKLAASVTDKTYGMCIIEFHWIPKPNYRLQPGT